jgi:DNA repair exonuclease SbcCD ATPase subunit
MKNLLELLETLRVQLEEASSGLLGAEDTLSDATRDAEELDDEEEHKDELVNETEEMYEAVSMMNGEVGEAIEKLENLIAKIKGE